MSTFLEWLLATSLAWLVYAYVGYPALLYLLSRRARGSDAPPERFEPTVTLLMAAYNEEAVVGKTIENKLEIDYPDEKLDLIIVSDASTDATDAIVGDYVRVHPDRIRLVRQEPRQGKTSALNSAVGQARGQILLFSDANSLYDPSALRHLVANFADARVGYVTGRMIYTNPDGSITGDGCTAYMRYENMLRSLETQCGSVVGVDGGIDAVRKSLYLPMRPDQLPDFVLPLRVVEQGYRVAYEPEAVLKEPTLASLDQEYRMRVRVSLRAMWALFDLRYLFDPRRDALFSWQLISHKLLRYTAFVPQFLLLASNAMLLSRGSTVFWTLFGCQLLFYSLALVGYLTRAAARRPLVVTAPYYLCLLNLSCAHAFFKFLAGHRQATWQPRTG